MKRLLAITCLAFATSSGFSQEMISMAHPTGDKATSLLLIEATNPGEARVGQTVKMTVKVTNLSDTVALTNVKLTEHTMGGVELKKAEEANAPKANKKKGNAQPKKGNAQGNKANAQGNKANAQANKANNQPKKAMAKKNADGFTIEKLAPGESRTFNMEMVGDNVGDGMVCFGATYEPVLCVQVKYVKPDLDLVKQAPERITICEQLVYNYMVKNSGNGTAKDVVLRDQLPEGVTTKDGKKEVMFEIGDLEAGKMVQKSAELKVCEPGTYSSRAMAESQKLNVKSKNTTTKVVAYDLSVKIDGKNEEFINKPVSYTITVTNDGNAVAKNTTLEVNNANGGRMIRATNEGKVEGTSNWNLGNLKAGESKQVRLTMLTSKDGKTVTVQAIAKSDCATACDNADEFAMAEEKTMTEIVTLPALQLYVVDSKDNLGVGEEFSYQIEVLNQGSASDHNLQIIVNLPEGIEFISGQDSNEAKATAEGQSVKFKKVDEIKAGETLKFDVKCKATKEGDYRTTVKMNSDYLDSSVPDVEPTRVVK